MKRLAMLLVAAACVLSIASVSAQTKPRWVQKGVQSMNRGLKSDSYGFLSFSTFGRDVDTLREQRLQPLLDYVGRKYGFAADKLQADCLGDDSGGAGVTYRISVPDGGAPVYAQLVDNWSHFGDDVVNWGFEYHQLYAVSGRSEAVPFDDFSLTERYGVKPLFMSLVPGLGQIYKGQPGKGYAILGTEIVLVSGIVYGELSRAHFARIGRKNGNLASYDSNITTFRQLRNVCIAGAGALYLYNLIDAVAAKGARRVVVGRNGDRSSELVFSPAVTDCGGIGAAMSVRF